MRAHNLLFGIFLGFSLVVVPTSAQAVVGIEVDVYLNPSGGASDGTLLGTAVGGADAGSATPFVISVNAGDTLRFVAKITAGTTGDAYATTISGIDLSELSFIAASGVDRSGRGFANFLGNPNDSIPFDDQSTGFANSTLTPGSSVELYRVDLQVSGIIPDAMGDIVFTLDEYGGTQGNLEDSLADTAVVQLGEAVIPALTGQGILVFCLTLALIGFLVIGRQWRRRLRSRATTVLAVIVVFAISTSLPTSADEKCDVDLPASCAVNLTNACVSNCEGPFVLDLGALECYCMSDACVDARNIGPPVLPFGPCIGNTILCQDDNGVAGCWRPDRCNTRCDVNDDSFCDTADIALMFTAFGPAVLKGFNSHGPTVMTKATFPKEFAFFQASLGCADTDFICPDADGKFSCQAALANCHGEFDVNGDGFLTLRDLSWIGLGDLFNTPIPVCPHE